MSVEEPGICASACAYAFLGKELRGLSADAKLGFHRFYSKDALASSTTKLFSGQDLDDTQRITAALSLYIVNMGVDARLLALASSSWAKRSKMAYASRGPRPARYLRPLWFQTLAHRTS